MVGGAILLGAGVLYNFGIMSYTERYREMATLKVVGFKDKKIEYVAQPDRRRHRNSAWHTYA